MQAQEKYLQSVAMALDEEFKEFYQQKMGFCLIVFPFDSDQSDYISNAERDDMVKALRITADRIESNAVIPPTVGSA